MAQGPVSRSARALGALAILVAMLVAFLAGILTERFRFDSKRDEVLQRYNSAIEQYHRQIMQSEKATDTRRP